MTGTEAPDSTADMTTSYSTRIGLLTDIHWTPDEAVKIREYLLNAFDQFETTGVERIVVLGDLIEEAEAGADATHDRLQNALSVFDETDLPVTYLLGNHDVMQGIGPTHFQEIIGYDPSLGTFPITDEITGVCLDTSAREYQDARGKLSEDSIQHLTDCLEQEEYVIVFSHHPLYYHELDRDGHFAEHPEVAFASNKYIANDLFEEYGNVVAAVNGHTHISDHTMYQDIPYMTINAFNKERPGHEDPNGSVAVLDVSPKQVKRISYTHGSYTSADTVQHPRGDPVVALGGTFGPIHDGHRQIFQRAFELGDVMIGLTTDELAEKTRHTERVVPSFINRREALRHELAPIAMMYDRDFEIRELTSPMEYVSDESEFTHLIVSPETFSRGEAVNEARLENGLAPLDLEIVDPVLADDGKRISSTRIVNGEIDEHGTLTE